MPRDKDPMELWVGTWVPEDVIDRETRWLAEHPAASVEEDRSRSDHRDE
ncbi:MAG: hypothetical protein HYY39_00445 [Armatimonadetes bacterium]|nr:hypothetical protein [Armatimonadota bacterium]MBI2972248.1 hypothetical protein [Armatimonadota bacterium]